MLECSVTELSLAPKTFRSQYEWDLFVQIHSMYKYPGIILMNIIEQNHWLNRRRDKKSLDGSDISNSKTFGSMLDLKFSCDGGLDNQFNGPRLEDM